MFPLQFHYEDVLRQDLLLKLDHANVQQVPGLCSIRVVPKAPYNNCFKNGKLAITTFSGQNLDNNVFVRFKGRNTGKLHLILDRNGVFRILPRIGRSFRGLRTYSRVQCDYCHFGKHTR